ncbi:MAG TPA: hypothetical protein VLA76_10475 [Candidatus Angelobacter sp.]|nr:hypothetical protein [Candidatus Angelobacter sp.]
MSVTGRGHTSTRTSLLVLLSAIALLFSAMALVRPLVPTVGAAHVEPIFVAGAANKQCGELTNNEFDYEFKIDPFPQSAGTYNYSDPNSDFEVELTVYADGSFDFEANIAVNAVFVKGGNEGGNLYLYAPPAMSDTGLDTPTGQAISHVSFCFDEPPMATPTPTPTPDEGEGIVEIDKFFCITDGEAGTQYFVFDPTFPTPTVQGQEEAEQPDEGCWTEAVAFTITGGDLEEPLHVMTGENGIIEFPLPDSDEPYTITEDMSGASAQFWVEDGALTAILVINWVEDDEGLLKVIKLFCDGEEASVEFAVEGGDVPVPVLQGCDVGDATFLLGDDIEFSTGADGLALLSVDAGLYTFAELLPNAAEYDGMVEIVDGEITTVVVFNTEGEEGEEATPTPTPTPTPSSEGVAGGTPTPTGSAIPDTATSPAMSGQLSAMALALLALLSMGVLLYARLAEARRRS